MAGSSRYPLRVRGITPPVACGTLILVRRVTMIKYSSARVCQYRHTMTGYQWGRYRRISDDRREGAGLGVKRQGGDIDTHIARADPAGVLVDNYTDNDLGAYKSKARPDYDRMCDDIRSGRINAICAWHNDRFHRPDLRELEDFIDLIEQHKVHVETVRTGPMDLSTPSGRFMARQLGIVARYESEHRSERLQAKHVELAIAGKSVGGGFRPYGYLREFDREERPHKIVREVIIPEEAEIIRECARRVLGGEGLRGVCTDLNERGIPTSAGGQWSTASLAIMLASARIAGYREHRPKAEHQTKRVHIGEITGKAMWPGIISLEDHKRLREILTSPSRRTSRGPTGRYLCSGGVLVCSRCTKNMTGKSRTDRPTMPSMYICDGQPGRKGCGHMYIAARPVDEVVTGWVATYLPGPAFQAALRRGGGPDESLLRDEITAAEHRREELAGDYASGTITRVEWLAARQVTGKRIERARR